MRYSKLYNTPIPQSQPLDPRQQKNNAGGFVFVIDKWSRLDRFLVLGSDSPTYYQNAPDLTRENASCVIECWDDSPHKTAEVISAISVEGRAPKNDAAIFALALGAAHKDTRVRQIALAHVPLVCRTSTHLFQFVDTAIKLGRGWGRSLKRAVANWYTDKTPDEVAYQMVKYRSREGYTHKRLMQTAHPDPTINGEKARVALYRYAWGTSFDKRSLPKIITAHEIAMNPDTTKAKRLELIREFKLPWEAIPTECNKDPDYWAAQLPTIGLTALVRNLGNMSRIGLLKPLSEAEKTIVARLKDETAIRKSRLHPFNILQALSIYSSGRGLKGSGTWDVNQKVVQALDGAFYKAFKNVEPTGKRHLLALDISGSMTMGTLFGSNLTPRDGTAAMALVTMATEDRTHVVGFTSSGGGRYSSSRFGDDGMTQIRINAGMSLKDAVRAVSNLPMGGTDCALPMLYALRNGLEVDVFVVMTDNETWAGSIHPMQALRDYRKKTGINAKLIVVGMTSTGFSIADPQDGGALDIVGFDSAAPAIMADFVRK